MSGGIGAKVGGAPDGSPLVDPALAAARLAGTLASVATGAIRVLVCDDSPGFRALMRYSLEEDGVCVVVGEAGDGAAGLAAVADLRPDVVLLDLWMPRLAGLDAIAEMRERSPGTRIVALSGFAAEDMEAAALARGAHRYLEKGSGLDAIRDAVHAAAAAGPPA